MANQLDEMNPVTMEEGRDANVIAKQVPIKVGWGSILFEVILWVLAIIPGLVFLIMKIRAGNQLRQLEQKINANASEIDNYLEQRVQILSNCAQLVEKSIKLDKETYTQIAALRSGGRVNDSDDTGRNELASKVDAASRGINVALERYPELQAHQQIRDAMQQNSYLQREITAARTVYNDSVNQWNHDVNQWPTKMIYAARHGYTTRIPFIASQEVKERARSTFFD